MTLKRSILTLVLALPAAAAAQTPAPYRPGLGDLMTMTVQPRHLKLGSRRPGEELALCRL